MNPNWNFETQPYHFESLTNTRDAGSPRGPTEMSIQDSLPTSSDWMDQTLGALSDVLSYDDDSAPAADWNSPSYLFDFGSSNDAHFQFMSRGIQSLNDIPSAPISDEPHQWSLPLDISMNDHPPWVANVNTEPTHSVLDENAVNGNCSHVSLKPNRIATNSKGRRQRKRKEGFNSSQFRRGRISPVAKTVLEIQFLREPYPKDDAMVALAAQTGLDKRTIKNWFCNTRSRGLLITRKCHTISPFRHEDFLCRYHLESPWLDEVTINGICDR
jgi:hypothetical protein